MFKRILKILGIVLACVVGACGAGVGIYALKGGFTEEKIDIVDLYFDDQVENTNDTTFTVNASKTNQTIYTLSDVTTSVLFTPLDATDKKLDVKITGVDGVLENKEELERGVTAGEEFSLRIRKDALGNNHGGVVNLTLNSPNELAEVTITLVVDVPIPDNSMYFTGSYQGGGNDKVTSSGNVFTLSRSKTESYVYLKSQLYNAFYLPVSTANVSTSTGNLKSTQISYYYEAQDKTYTYDSNELEIKNVYDEVLHKYSYCYKIPIIPEDSGTITFTAKTHRSYAIQKEFEENNFGTLKTLIANQGLTQENQVKANQMKRAFTEFVNKYISYFDDTEASYNFFRECVDKDGKIKFDTDASIIEALDEYVFVTCSATVDVTAVNLSKIESSSDAITYNVFDTTYFSKTNDLTIGGNRTESVFEEFDLKITLNNNDGEVYDGTSEEEAKLFDTLDMGAYLYVQAEESDDDDISNETIPVYGFKDDQPITPLVWETLSEAEKYEYYDGESYTIVGYLYKITSAMKNNKFMDVVSGVEDGDVYWTANFNVPFQEEKGATEITKALFFRFSVTGVDKDSKNIEREAFTRVYITYTEYEYGSKEEEHLSIKSVSEEGTLSSFNTTMALNTELSDNTTYALNVQNLAIDTSSDAIKNYNGAYSDGTKIVPQVEYKSVMYFVEASSNETLDGDAKQVVAVGRYNFYNMSGNPYTYGGEDSLLEGQRIPTYNMVDGKKQFYLQTLNASGLDEIGLDRSVKIFAVVYLSDKDGNPISLNGEKIVIDEGSAESVASLYVIAMSSVSSFTSVVIHNVVDNVNFYTIMADAMTVCETDEYSISYGQGEWVKRNFVNGSYKYNDGTFEYDVTGNALSEYNKFLKLKLLKNKDFKLYVTNFEIGKDGSISDEDIDKEMSIVGLDGNISTYEFSIKVSDNKQIAFNDLCKNLQTYYGLSNINNVNVEGKVDFEQDEVTKDYKYFVYTIKADSDSATSMIYNVSLVASGIPYSMSARQDYVRLEVNEIEIADVTLSDETTSISQSVSLTASYANRKGDSEGKIAKGSVEFYQQGEGNTKQYESYTIDNIKYSVSTNLITLENGANVVNTEVVDSSQAIYQSGGDLAEDGVGEDIYNYIYYYTKSSLGAKISYSLVSDFAILQNEMSLTVSDDGKWYIGDKSYEDSQVITDEVQIDAKGNKMKYLELDGVRYFEDYKVTGEGVERVITYPINSYFPVISRGTENYMLAFGTEFKLYSRDGHTLFRHSSNELGKVQESAVILSKNFGLDGAIENGSNVQYETKSYVSIVGTDKNQTYTLIKGEDHTDKYYEDNSGKYKFEGGKFSLASVGYTGTKYSKSETYGVMAYVFINFGFIPVEKDSYDVNITKVLSFNLIQNELEFDLYVNGSENASNNRISVNGGGGSVEIPFNPNAEKTNPSTTGIFTNDTNVIGHIDIENLIEGVEITCDQNSDRLIIRTTTNFGGAQDKHHSFKISYIFKGKKVSHEYYLAIAPNYNFSFNGSSSTSEHYVMTLDAYGVNRCDYEKTIDDTNYITKYNLLDILGTTNGGLIESGVLSGSRGFSGYRLEWMSINTNFEPGTYDSTSGVLSVGRLFSSEITDKIEYFMEFKVFITVNGEEIELDRTLKIELNPTYIVKFEEWNNANSIDVYNGENIYDHFKVYGYNVNTAKYDSLITDTELIRNAISISIENPTSGATISNGVIDVYGGGVPKADNTTVSLKVVYGKPQDANKMLSVNVVGIKMFYSTTGDVDGADAQELTSNITLEISDKIDISNYIKFTTADGEELDVILKDISDESNAIYGGEVDVTPKTYKIYVGKNDSGTWKEIADTTLTLTITVLAE